jgi:hypothetical protein
MPASTCSADSEIGDRSPIPITRSDGSLIEPPGVVCRPVPSISWRSMIRAIEIVCPRESAAETQPQLQPALLRLSAMTSQHFAGRLNSASFAVYTATTK